jgi:hypothetical protein
MNNVDYLFNLPLFYYRVSLAHKGKGEPLKLAPYVW